MSDLEFRVTSDGFPNGALPHSYVGSFASALDVARHLRLRGDLNIRMWRREVPEWEPCQQSEFPGKNGARVWEVRP